MSSGGMPEILVKMYSGISLEEFGSNTSISDDTRLAAGRMIDSLSEQDTFANVSELFLDAKLIRAT